MSFITMRESFIEEVMDGINACVQDLEDGEIYDIEEAIQGFVFDPADTPFQAGYLEALVGIDEHGLLPTIGTLISGDMRKVLEELNE